jgi:hypothetical protein
VTPRASRESRLWAFTRRATSVFENIALASQTDPVVQVFEATNVFAVYLATGALTSSGVLPVRWRDATGARGIPTDASWTFSMHAEA